MIMNIYIDMLDTKSNELIARKTSNYALNFNVKHDNGFEMLHRWLESSVRGVRLSEHKDITLKIRFTEEKESLPLFNNKQVNYDCSDVY